MIKTLCGSFYNPIEGGHAPGDLRDAFLEGLQLFWRWRRGMPEPMVELRGTETPLYNVCRMLWNCTDALPGHAVFEIESNAKVRAGSYAGAARWMRGKLEGAGA